MRTRARICSRADRPRLLVHRSHQQISAQIIDPSGRVLASASSLKLKAKSRGEAAAQVGELIAKAASDKKVAQVTFDRKYYKYHGQVKILAESARKHGLKF